MLVHESEFKNSLGLLRAAMRSPNPTVFFEHRALLMTSEGSARYPGDDYMLPLGRAAVLREGTDLTLVTWGALVHRAREAAERFGDALIATDQFGELLADQLAHLGRRRFVVGQGGELG